MTVLIGILFLIIASLIYVNIDKKMTLQPATGAQGCNTCNNPPPVIPGCNTCNTCNNPPPVIPPSCGKPSRCPSGLLY